MRFGGVILTLFLTTTVAPIASNSQDLKTPAAKEIKGLAGKMDLFKVASRDRPLEVRNRVEASMFFSPDEVKKIEGQVKFDQQRLLVFAWRGSGQDRLTSSILESFPEQFQVKYAPGRTRDLRPHVYVFALRKNVIWKGDTVRPTAKEKDSSDYIKVEIKGKLNSRVFAIGAETPGVQIASNGVTWELDFPGNPKLAKLAQKYDGKTVLVTGMLTTKRGVEIRTRTIVKVSSLRLADR